MTNQEKKEYLSRYRLAGREVQRLEEDIQRLEAQATAITPRYGSEPGGRAGDKIQGAVDKILELQVRLAEKLEEQIALRREIEGAIDTLPELRLRQIMRYRYIEGWTWEKVAEQMEVSNVHIFRLHSSALKKLIV